MRWYIDSLDVSLVIFSKRLVMFFQLLDIFEKQVQSLYHKIDMTAMFSVLMFVEKLRKATEP